MVTKTVGSFRSALGLISIFLVTPSFCDSHGDVVMRSSASTPGRGLLVDINGEPAVQKVSQTSRPPSTASAPVRDRETKYVPELRRSVQGHRYRDPEDAFPDPKAIAFAEQFVSHGLTVNEVCWVSFVVTPHQRPDNHATDIGCDVPSGDEYSLRSDHNMSPLSLRSCRGVRGLAPWSSGFSVTRTQQSPYGAAHSYPDALLNGTHRTVDVP